jgi:hypothetical protein
MTTSTSRYAYEDCFELPRGYLFVVMVACTELSRLR